MAYTAKQSFRRVGFLDEARGFWVIMMVLYHTAYDIVYIFGVNWPFFYGTAANVFQKLIVGSFICISGICCQYSRNNIKRGAITLAIGLAMTAFTYFFMKDQVIYFGVLHFLGCAMIVFSLLATLLDRLPSFWGMLSMIILLLLTWSIPSGYIGFLGLFRFPLPQFLYNVKFLFPLGFPGPGFYSTDYVPLIPWLFAFLAGSYIGVFFQQGILPTFMYQTHSTSLSKVGRHALPIYVLHQPIVYGLLTLIFMGLGALGLYVRV